LDCEHGLIGIQNSSGKEAVEYAPKLTHFLHPVRQDLT
jgi:hypothetical protein